MEKNNNIEVQINLTPKDRERAMFYNYFIRRKPVLFEVIFIALLALACIVLKLGNFWEGMPKGLFYIGIVIFVLLAFFLFYIKLLASAGGTGKTRYVTITPQSLTTRVSGEKKEFTVKWEDFSHVTTTKYNYLFYPDMSQYLVIPRRYFTEEEQHTIQSYLR